MDPKSITDTVI